MKKVLCNVLYKATIPVIHKEIGLCDLTIGIFDDENNANIASGIFRGVVSQAKNDFAIDLVSNYEIEKSYVPETDMSKQYIQENLVENLETFFAKNSHIHYFVSKYGEKELEKIINEAGGNVEKSDLNVSASQKQ